MKLVPNNTYGAVGLACCSLSGIACVGAVTHLMSKSAAVRTQLFWAQLVALSLSDICCCLFMLSVFICYDGEGQSAGQGITAGCLFWSLFLEVQIAVGVACSVRGANQWTNALRKALLASFIVAVGLALLDMWLVMRGMHSAHELLWTLTFLTSFLLAFGAYALTRASISASPKIVRRRLMLRWATYALNFSITFLPNALLDVLITLKVVNLSRLEHSFCEVEDAHIGYKTRLDTIFRYLYCVNGALNVSTYLWWMWIDGRTKQRAALGDIDNLEESLMIGGYFDLTDASFEARSIADAIGVAQESRVSGMSLPRRSC